MDMFEWALNTKDTQSKISKLIYIYNSEDNLVKDIKLLVAE